MRLTKLELLKRTKEVLKRHGWISGDLARRRRLTTEPEWYFSVPCPPDDDKACAFCMVGAAMRAQSEARDARQDVEFVSKQLGFNGYEEAWRFNDGGDRRRVMNYLNRQIRKLEGRKP